MICAKHGEVVWKHCPYCYDESDRIATLEAVLEAAEQIIKWNVKGDDNWFSISADLMEALAKAISAARKEASNNEH